MSVIEIIHEDDEYIAIDQETGAEGHGETKGLALVALGATLSGAVGAAAGATAGGVIGATTAEEDEERMSEGLLSEEDLLEGNFHTQEDIEELVD